MQNEYNELIEVAIYKEIASEALYVAAQNKTTDEAVKILLAELAQKERQHKERLQQFKESDSKIVWNLKSVVELRISEYLTSPDTIEGAGLQDTLIFAVKQEQKAIDFYSRMTGIVQGRLAKNLCSKLVNDELRHKLKLELIYDQIFYIDN